MKANPIQRARWQFHLATLGVVTFLTAVNAAVLVRPLPKPSSTAEGGSSPIFGSSTNLRGPASNSSNATKSASLVGSKTSASRMILAAAMAEFKVPCHVDGTSTTEVYSTDAVRQLRLHFLECKSSEATDRAPTAIEIVSVINESNGSEATLFPTEPGAHPGKTVSGLSTDFMTLTNGDNTLKIRLRSGESKTLTVHRVNSDL